MTFPVWATVVGPSRAGVARIGVAGVHDAADEVAVVGRAMWGQR